VSRPELRRWSPGDAVEPLAELLRRGGVLAIPTESSYGLAVDPRNRKGVDAVFAIKRRPADRPLPIVVANIEQIEELGGSFPNQLARELAREWPAPLTLLLPLVAPLPAAAGSSRAGFRVPAHAELRQLLAELGTGLSATSANLSGEPPVLDPEELPTLLEGADAALFDGGRLPGGAPSTVVGVEGGELQILRQGSFGVEQSISFSAPSVEISVDDAS
jgi:L-threonylcarbamoyladenylate synthase